MYEITNINQIRIALVDFLATIAKNGKTPSQYKAKLYQVVGGDNMHHLATSSIEDFLLIHKGDKEVILNDSVTGEPATFKTKLFSMVEFVQND